MCLRQSLRGQKENLFPHVPHPPPSGLTVYTGPASAENEDRPGLGQKGNGENTEELGEG